MSRSGGDVEQQEDNGPAAEPEGYDDTASLGSGAGANPVRTGEAGGVNI